MYDINKLTVNCKCISSRVLTFTHSLFIWTTGLCYTNWRSI